MNYPFLIIACVILFFSIPICVMGIPDPETAPAPDQEWWRSIVGRLLHWEKDPNGRFRRGSWSQTYSGLQIYQLDPVHEDVCYDDICVGISREGRYVNQTREFYSVGEHSVLVSVYCEKLARERGWAEDQVRAVAREGLLHDASEAYLGDVSRHLKRQREMRGYRRAEARWEKCIFKHFEIVSTVESAALVKEVDTRIVLDEIEALLYDPDMWKRSGRYLDIAPLGAEISGFSWQQACSVFSMRFAELFPDFVGIDSEIT